MQAPCPSPRSEPLTEDSRALRALAVLEQLAAAGQPYSLSQLSLRLHIPKATLMRLIESLEAQGYVTHLPDSRGSDRGITLGPKAAQLALTTLANNTFGRACRSLLRALVDVLGETCNLTALDRDTVLYLERVETAEPLRLHLQPGTRVPLHCTASGKLFLAQMPPVERRAMLARLTLERKTQNTLTEMNLLEAELDRLAVRGIGIDNEELVRGMVAVAVPVRDASGMHLLAALAIHAPTARANLNDLLKCVPRLKEAALKLAPLLSATTSMEHANHDR